MVCPYAKQIRGSIAICTLINRKVSTLRYPCKGNYRRCPIYLRYAARTVEAPRRVEREEIVKPGERAPPARVERVEEKPPTISPGGEARPIPTRERGVFRPSESLCDSLILASLTVASKPIGIARGKISDLVERAREHVREESIVFILGDIGGYRMRLLYMGTLATYSFEKEGRAFCGEEAEKIFNSVKDEEFDGIYYTVKLSDIPLWRESILKELGKS